MDVLEAPNVNQKALFEHLKRVRAEVARSNHTHSYLVFPDASLGEMAARIPTCKEEFLEIKGVADLKMEKYGEAFIREIKNFVGEDFLNWKDAMKKQEESKWRQREEYLKKNNKKKEFLLREWVPTQIELFKDDLEALQNVMLLKSGKKNEDKRNAKEKQQRLISITVGKGPNMYLVTAKNVIGAVELPSKILIIQPKISVRNILFLLCYSWEPLDWKASFELFKETEDKMDALSNAIVMLFTQKTSKAFSKGILQGYSMVDDTLSSVRGRIRFSDQISKRFGRVPPVEVTYEDFSEDVEENRLLKAAAFSLERMKSLSPQLRHSLKRIQSQLAEVQLVEYDVHYLPEISFSPLNEHYRQAVDLALFVLKNRAWTLLHGTYESPTFLLYMPKVFEDFVVGALRESPSLQKLGATAKTFPQNKPLRFDVKGNIQIKPDFSFWEGSVCRFVGDCKYKRLVRKCTEELDAVEDDVNALTPDLYQMLSYTVATNLGIGLLVYAEDHPNDKKEFSKPIYYPDLQPNFTNTLLKRRAVNLNTEPVHILEQIEELAKEIAQTINSKRKISHKEGDNPKRQRNDKDEQE